MIFIANSFVGGDTNIMISAKDEGYAIQMLAGFIKEKELKNTPIETFRISEYKGDMLLQGESLMLNAVLY